MPAVSRRQARFMAAVAAGQATKRTSLTRGQAREFLRGTHLSKLPEEKRKRKTAMTSGHSEPLMPGGR